MVKPGVREDIVQSAVRFLKDPKVQESPLAKRIAFLETKGLSADEIEEAMSRTSGSSSSGATSAAVANGAPPLPPSGPAGYAQSGAYPVVYNAAGYPQPVAYGPPQAVVQPYTWKDYTLGAVGAIGAGYGVYTLAKRYLLPLLSFPSEKSLEASNAQIASQLESTSSVLEVVKEETSEVMKAVDAQAVKVSKALEGMVDTLKALREKDERRDKELEELKGDIDSIRDMIPKMLDKTKESQTAVISDLQTEIKSLKNLLLNRRLPVSAPTPSTSLPGTNDGSTTPVTEPGPFARGGLVNIPSKPTIPAWQLQQQAEAAAADATPAEGSADKGKKPEE
ncbi:uncharacterized protein SPPG_02205 [Spizellomyces punctatus DAOM BR117]|uniref:Peroxisomal membrane protein PEX14 n=1 Tax=Spizellomyces punctatus (strain DAOM BR117) TaxID=645134 RepID=A0A0L0HPX6_SPIPD|nr:uncharacterized protein SPPG_02205 [Spizellomyces punctatus DAOM BR117]KND03142.1 hypothetical protein SPPG_02205 [Spizellomyces punctatus DAOM BR117]|eukprot:XP_016611181.1 hypothetical protein SPPG_02205 [Spizellomyces punctatus DAOM BR117]